MDDHQRPGAPDPRDVRTSGPSRPLADPTASPAVPPPETRRVAERRGQRRADPFRSAAVLAMAAPIAALAAAAAAVAAVAGLLGASLVPVAGLAALALGVALTARSGALAARFSEVMDQVHGDVYERAEVGAARGVEILLGIAAVVLALIALAGVAPVGMLLAAAFVVAIGCLTSGASEPETAELTFEPLPPGDGRARVRRVARATGAALDLGSIGALVLVAIAAFAAEPRPTLLLVALLVLGVALLVSGVELAIGLAVRRARDRSATRH